jgi:hypothetical protein
MRVWALASCSGLLALAACSAEQSSTPNPVGGSSDGNNAVQVNTQLGLTAPSSSSMARPEVGRRQVLHRPAVKPVSMARGVVGQTLPQSAQLRERLQRLRAQNSLRVAPNIPLVTAPIPAHLPQGAPRPQPTPIEAGTPARNQSPSPVAPVIAQGKGVSSSASIALPTLPRPTLNSEASGVPQTSVDPVSPGTAADLGPLAAASLATSYPIAPQRHQGYSARSQQPAPVLAVPTAAQAERDGSPVAAATPRLHGETSADLQAWPTVGAASPGLEPLPGEAVPSDAALPSPTAQSAGVPHPGGPRALTVTPRPESPLGGDSGDHSQVATPRLERPVGVLPPAARAPVAAETPIAPPESLPLQSPSPPVSHPRMDA